MGTFEFFWTVITGVSIILFGQFFLKLILEPLDDFLKLRRKIEQTLIFYANVYCNPSPTSIKTEEANKFLRSLSSEVLVKQNDVRGYGFFRLIKLLPKKEGLEKVQINLMNLSNSLNDRDKASENSKKAEEIKKLLRS